MPNEAPNKEMPYCITDNNGKVLNWYSSEAEANRAMHRTMGMMYSSLLVPVRDFSESAWGDDNTKWIQMYPYDTWDHPLYGPTTIDENIAKQLKTNFDKGVRGQKLLADYEHGLDRAKGSKAAGEIKEVAVKDDGLWGLVAFTEPAREEIDKGEWNYWSTSHYDLWEHPHNGIKYNYVLDGGALTNSPWVKGMAPLNFSELFIEKDAISTKMRRLLGAKDHATALTIVGEMAPEEFMEPGTGFVDPEINRDDSADTGSRRDTPPAGEDGTVPDRSDTVENSIGKDDMDFEKELRELLAIGDDVDALEYVKGLNDELGPLRELKKDHADKKRFSEQFPDEYERMKKLEIDNRESEARRFSEALLNRRLTRTTGETEGEGEDIKSVVESTTLGLSAIAVDEISGVVKKFSEGTVKLEDFTGAVDAILNNGIVDYGNRGSELAPVIEDITKAAPKNFIEARKQFSEKVNEIVENDKIDFNAAIVQAAKKYPELYEQYQGGHVMGGVS